jgi:hypothetical protein
MGMTLPATTAAERERPASTQALRAYATRLAEVDLWAESARTLDTVTGEDATTAQRVEAAWAHLRAGNASAARAALDAVTGTDSSSVAALDLTLDALDGDVAAYHRLLADGTGPGADLTGLRLALAASTSRADLPVATRIAKAVLTHASGDADAWSVVAAHKATLGQFPAALAAVERARRDRLDCQDDPAAATLALLDASGHGVVATMPVCHGAVSDATDRPGWPGWPGLLNDRVPAHAARSWKPVTAVTALTGAAATLALLAGEPEAVVLHVALAASALAWLRSRGMDGLDAATTRLARAAHRRSRGTARRLWDRARTDPFATPTGLPVSPQDCCCWESDLLSGPFWSTYLAAHLRAVWTDEPSGMSLVSCPESGKRFLYLADPGVAVLAPDTDASAAAASAASSGGADTVKTGQYL